MGDGLGNVEEVTNELNNMYNAIGYYVLYDVGGQIWWVGVVVNKKVMKLDLD